jgi:hypothetical protein
MCIYTIKRWVSITIFGQIWVQKGVTQYNLHSMGIKKGTARIKGGNKEKGSGKLAARTQGKTSVAVWSDQKV